MEVQNRALQDWEGAGDGELQARPRHIQGDSPVISTCAGVEQFNRATLLHSDAAAAFEQQGVVVVVVEVILGGCRCPSHT